MRALILATAALLGLAWFTDLPAPGASAPAHRAESVDYGTLSGRVAASGAVSGPHVLVLVTDRDGAFVILASELHATLAALRGARVELEGLVLVGDEHPPAIWVRTIRAVSQPPPPAPALPGPDAGGGETRRIAI